MPRTKPKPKPKSTKSSLVWDEYCRNPDPDLLRVYADALEQEGDLRGVFLQTCMATRPTKEQELAKARFLRTSAKKVLGGPGAEHLREIELGPNGLVARARTELGKVLKHVDAIERVNPRLVLTITSLRTLTDAKSLAKVPLGGIYLVDFETASINDKELEALAPALAQVRHLRLPCRGDKFFTPDGLRVLGQHVKALRYLGVEFYPTRGPKASAYARAIAESPGFATLRGLDLSGVTTRDVPGRKLVLDTKLYRHGKPRREVLAAVEKTGRELADQLDAVLAP